MIVLWRLAVCLVAVEGPYEGDVCWRIVEMDCSEIDVCDCDIRLCYDGENGTGCAILIVLGLIVYDNSRSLRRYGRHLRCKDAIDE